MLLRWGLHLRHRHGRTNRCGPALHLATPPAEIAARLPVAAPTAEIRAIAPVGSFEARLRLRLGLRLLNLLGLLELRPRFGRAHFALRLLFALRAVLALLLGTALSSVAVILRKRSRRDQRRSRHDRGEQRLAHQTILNLRPDAMSGR
ncbi:hypothetical protein GCM10011395_20090 [Sphingomonas psychrolutea]|uniref:Uncharacterized protein n=1 Tax=Sphingomonas psychrolutea TaxID=1259676 RepID=A0ABQ1GST8_9SPHN|nr:hypothetical protein GCM10011395_20090 [Sphingomonas psychrolutea]